MAGRPRSRFRCRERRTTNRYLRSQRSYAYRPRIAVKGLDLEPARNLHSFEPALRSIHVLIRNVLPFAAALAFTFSSAAAVAQDAPVTGLDKQLSRIDFAVQGVGMFSKTVQGTICLLYTSDAADDLP